jgi:hypothetical protein
MSPAEYGNRGFPFAFVLWSVLRRGLVMTDNRRLPLRRRFSYEDIWEPGELRDGADTAAELYRLKTGDAKAREHFIGVQETYRSLTGRVLDVRARRASAGDGQEPGMVIEPVAVTATGELPVEFCGAGAQEAVLLSVLLSDRTGRVLVLDELAVNLEPTAQRRPLRNLRGPGSAWSSRTTPTWSRSRSRPTCAGSSGSPPGRPAPGCCTRISATSALESQRRLRLLEPVHLRGCYSRRR